MPDGPLGRRWLAELELPPDERETVGGCLREVGLIERELASEALDSEEIRRLMTGLLAPARQRRGLRIRTAVADPPQAARARAKSRGRLAPRAQFGPTRARNQEGSRPRGRVRRADGDGLPQARRRLAAQTNRKRCGRDMGTRISKAAKRQAARQGHSPEPCALARRRPHQQRLSHKGDQSSRGLDFHLRPRAPRLRGLQLRTRIRAPSRSCRPGPARAERPAC